MNTRTWHYGTTRAAVVTHSSDYTQLVVDDEGEGHALCCGAQDRSAKVGDKGTLTFTRGATGGFWKFTKLWTP